MHISLEQKLCGWCNLYRVLIILSIFLTTIYAQENLRFGVQAHTTKEITKQKYQPLVDYLNSKLDKKIVLEVLSQSELEDKIASASLDIITTNPGHYITLRDRFELGGVVAVLARTGIDNVPVYKLGGVIVSRADSDIKELRDVAKKSISAAGTEHLGAYWAQAYELEKAGVKISTKDNKIVFTDGSQADAIKNVINGVTEVGFARDGVIEDLVANSELNLSELKIINPLTYPEHPYIVSTELYPEWPLFIMPHLSTKDIKSLIVALLSITPDNKEILAQGIYGYSIVSDYHKVEELAVAMRLPPYDKIITITNKDIWQQYKKEIIFIIIMILAIIAYYQYDRYKKRLFLTLLNSIGDGVYSVDNKERCTWINEHALALIGYDKDEVIGADTHKLFHYSDDNDALTCPIAKTIADKKIRTKERVFIDKNGSFIDVNMTVAPTPKGAIVIFRDITQEKKLKETLHLSEKNLKKAQEIAKIGSWELDLKTSKLNWSDQIYKIFEIDSKQFSPTYESFIEKIHPADRALVNDSYLKSLESREFYNVEHRLLMSDGSIKWVRGSGESEYNDDGIATISRGTVQDITDFVNATNELQQVKSSLEELNDVLQSKNKLLKEQAMRDGLTGIANRRSFDEIYSKMYKESAREKTSIAILMIDVDLFKLYNDFYGHIAGDECLKSIAKSLEQTLKRPSDLAARFGGEEFVVVIKNVDEDGVVKVATKLNRAIEALEIEHQKSSVSRYVTVSVGAAIRNHNDELSQEELIKNADEALYMAKNSGRNRVCLFNQNACASQVTF